MSYGCHISSVNKGGCMGTIRYTNSAYLPGHEFLHPMCLMPFAAYVQDLLGLCEGNRVPHAARAPFQLLSVPTSS